MSGLPAAFLETPVAHRGLHDRSEGRIENSRSAFEAAISGGYGIELDVQMSRDGVPMVFHDHDLDRLTALSGPLRGRASSELCGIPLAGGHDTIERLDTVLELIGDRAAVLVEIKDQTGVPEIDIADLAQLTGRVVRAASEAHGTRAAIMSFNPAYVAALDWLGADLPRGLIGMVFDDPRLSAAENADLTGYAAFDASGASFISHDRASLDAPAVTRLKARGVPVLTWTVRSAAEEAEAREIADNITFEGYLPARAAP
ncbi:MAG: glycerophosphodiester phosphodiesterase family protein [Paracoccaceae bacterium]|nr:glycerophosphodiester phosphodiesterase family protein [Paracoccaceae bacterium]